MLTGLPKSLFSTYHFVAPSINLQLISPYTYLTYSIIIPITMSRLGTLREWVRLKTSSLFAANRISNFTTGRNTRTKSPQTADGRHSSEATRSESLHCHTYAYPHTADSRHSSQKTLVKSPDYPTYPDPHTADSRHSSEKTLVDPPDCPICTYPTPTTPQARGYMTYNDDGAPHSQAEIQVHASEAATAYVAGVFADCSDTPKGLRAFSYYASQLEGEYDLGVKNCTNAMLPRTDEELGNARSAAFTIWELGGCPTRELALAYLDSEYLRSRPKPLFEQRLRDVNAAMEDAANRGPAYQINNLAKDGLEGGGTG
jgi:hypothetical protein